MPLPVGHAREALAKWAGFPANQEPRPIVLTELGIEALEALKEDREWRAIFDSPGVAESDLPAELLPAAVDYCRDVQTGERRPLAPIIRANGRFATDRGVRELPSWMMYPPDRRWPFIGLDPEFKRRSTWCPEGLRVVGDEVSTLAEDGRTVTYRFMGTPKSYADYPHAEVFETETAVLVHPVEVRLDKPGAVRAAYVEKREVLVQLADPLGNRVLIWTAHGPDSDTFGAPRTVIATTGTT